MGLEPINYQDHCRFQFGACVQSEHQTNPTNNMEERTMGCICLDSMDGPQGGHMLLNLLTGEKGHRQDHL